MRTKEFFNRVVCIQPENTDAHWLKEREAMFNPKIFGKVSGVTQSDSKSLLMPYGAAFSQPELAQLLAFYHAIQSAYIDNIGRLLILSDKIKIDKNFDARAERIYDGLSPDWDLVYFGFDNVSYRDKPKKDIELTQINYANGLVGLAVHYRFYQLFLTDAKVPKYNLDAHIKALSLACNIYCVNPPLVKTTN